MENPLKKYKNIKHIRISEGQREEAKKTTPIPKQLPHSL